jgi:NAD-dependent dihydropyrimidine dehydrogenase PreA subunit
MSAEPAAQELHAIFIDVEVDDEVAQDAEVAAKLAEVCPVDIFATADDATLRIVAENLDECVLCELCIEAAPKGTIRVRKLYDGTALGS